MPYQLRKKGSRYEVVNAETGEVHAKATTKAKAERQLNLLRGLDRGWKPTGKNTYTRTMSNGQRVRLRVTSKTRGGRSGKTK